MRLTRALTIFSLVPASSSLSTAGNTHQSRQRRQPAKTSLFLSENGFPSRGRPDRRSRDVLATEVESPTQQKRQTERTVSGRPAGAPLVDSALLRFLSNQKKEQNDMASIPLKYSSSSESKVNTESRAVEEMPFGSLGEYDVRQQRQIQQQQQQQQPSYSQQIQQPAPPTSGPTGPTVNALPLLEANGADSATTIKPPSVLRRQLTEDSPEAWMGQFNRNRVAQLLMANGGGLAEASAQVAGDSVQRHVLARLARRQIRRFLKERDIFWRQGDNAQQNDVAVVERRIAPMKTPDYGFSHVVDFFVEHGLTSKDIAAILTHTPSVALMRPTRRKPVGDGAQSGEQQSNGETLEETLNRALSKLLCGTLQLRKYDARKVLRTCPGLLTSRGSKSAELVVSSLATLGVSASSIARDKNALPALLSRSPASLFRLIAFLSSDAIRMPVKNIGPLLRRSNCLELLDAVAPVPRLGQTSSQQLTAPADCSPDGSAADDAVAIGGKSADELRRKVDSTYERMSSTAWTLRNEIGTADLGKVISAYPSVLLLDVSEQILPAASYLMDELGIWEGDLPRVLQLYPSLLGLPVSKMKEVVSFMIAEGVVEENLASVFRSFPALLTLDVEEDMKSVVDFLKSIGINNVGRFITRLPPILGYSVERELRPKWEFIKDVYTYDTFELSKFPAYFSYPLERVIKSRFEYLRDEKELPTPLIAPDLVLRYGDRDFATKVAGDKDGGVAFSLYLKQRQQSLAKGSGRQKRRATAKKANNPGH